MKAKVIFDKQIEYQDIEFKFNEVSKREVNKGIAEKAARNWDIFLKEAKERGVEIWDGEQFRLDSFDYVNGKLLMEVSKIKFSQKRPLNNMMDELEPLGFKYFPNVLAVTALIKTSDKKYIFGVKSGKTVGLAKTDFIGGMVEEIDLNVGKDLLKMLYREIQEEIGLTPEQVDNAQFKGIVSSNFGNVIFINTFDTDLDSDDVNKIFKKDNDGELARLEFISEEELIDYLRKVGGAKEAAIELL